MGEIDLSTRPPEGWSARAEYWADLRHLASYRSLEELHRERRRRLEAEQDAELLYAALECERAKNRRSMEQMKHGS